MRNGFPSLLHSNNDFLQGLSGLFLVLISVLTGWMVACTAAVASAPSAQTQPYTFYLYAWTEDNAENWLVPLEPETLNDQTEGRSMGLGRTWRLSSDGSTLVNVEYPEGRASLDAEDIWIVVYDLQSGVERNRFHPPVRGLVSDLSEDGGRLLMQPDPYTPSGFPPIVEWYVVDTANGELLAHVKDADNACFRQRAYFGPAGDRLYCVVDPAVTGVDEPEAMHIAAYDVESGLKAGEVELPEVFTGGSEMKRDDQPVETFLEPAVVLSPDGQRLAIFHADTEKITLIDAHSLTVEKSFSLRRSTNLWGWLGLAPAVAQAKGEMQGTIRHATFNSDGQYLYVFSQEVWVRPEDAPTERGLWVVDLEQGSIVAEALLEYQIQWVRPAPDGTVYVFGTTDKRLLPYEIRSTSPSMLWHLDGRALEILAERPFTGYRQGWIVEGTADMDSHEAVSTNEQYEDCPVTRPPKSPFIPPEPWPSQPPGKDQFWLGDNGLWTALPASGSWRQLALGEKFWWWSEEFDVTEDAMPNLTVTARRLDGDAPSFQVSEATNGYHESFNWAMLIGVELASPGCWEFTGQYKGHQLSFVLWVPPQ